MRGAVLTLALGTICILVVAAACAFATSNVVTGTFMSEVSGSDDLTPRDRSSF